MKKNFIKCLTIITLFCGLIYCVPVNAATNAPSSMKVESKTPKLRARGSISHFYFKKITVNGDKKIAYCTDYNKVVPDPGTSIKKVKEMDAGYTYIINNGYPKKRWFSDDKTKDYYITQVAIWYYQGSVTTKNVESIVDSVDSTHSKAQLQKMITAIKELKKGADTAKGKGYSKPSISVGNSVSFTLSSDGNYYVSNEIGVNATSISGNYEVSLNSAPKGTVITDTANKNTTKFATTKKFIIKIPASSINVATTKFKIGISATGVISKVYKYGTTDTKNQGLLPSALYNVTSSVSASKSVSVAAKTYNIKVVKRDSVTKKTLAGATMVLKDSSGAVAKDVKGKTVGNITTTTNTTTISGLLAGTYTLTETKAPEGYELNSTAEKIIVSGTATTVTKEFFNTPKPLTYTLTVNKKDIDTKASVNGATIVIKQGEEVKKECVMTDSSVCSISGLSAGTYTVQETKAPEGYLLSTEVKTIPLSGNTTTKVVDFYNTKKGIAKISKVDITTQDELAGASLVVKDASGTTVDSWVSKEEVHYISLEPGIYTLTETQAPEGYELNITTISFEVKSGGVVTEVKMENTEKEIIVTPEPTPEEPEEEVVSVPSTGINTIITYVLSGLAIIAGGLIIYKNSKAHAKEK